MEDGRARKFTCLLVWKLDRFGGPLVDSRNNMRFLEGHGIRFVAATLPSIPISRIRLARSR